MHARRFPRADAAGRGRAPIELPERLSTRRRHPGSLSTCPATLPGPRAVSADWAFWRGGAVHGRPGFRAAGANPCTPWRRAPLRSRDQGSLLPCRSARASHRPRGRPCCASPPSRAPAPPPLRQLQGPARRAMHSAGHTQREARGVGVGQESRLPHGVVDHVHGLNSSRKLKGHGAALRLLRGNGGSVPRLRGLRGQAGPTCCERCLPPPLLPAVPTGHVSSLPPY
jgi:hypothetical protein